MSFSTGELGFEAFGTACGLAVVAGALSVLNATFDGLTVTLVALAVAGWASLRRQRPGRDGPAGRPGAFLLPFALLVMAVAVFFDPPAPVEPWRALLLGLGTVPLWAMERRRPVGARPSRSEH